MLVPRLVLKPLPLSPSHTTPYVERPRAGFNSQCSPNITTPVHLKQHFRTCRPVKLLLCWHFVIPSDLSVRLFTTTGTNALILVNPVKNLKFVSSSISAPGGLKHAIFESHQLQCNTVNRRICLAESFKFRSRESKCQGIIAVLFQGPFTAIMARFDRNGFPTTLPPSPRVATVQGKLYSKIYYA